MVTIKTERLVLRPYREGDETQLISAINHRRIAQATLTIPHPYTREHAREWIRRCRRARNELLLAILHEKNLIGGISLEQIEGHKAELGYWLTPREWGKGLATEAVSALTRYGFKTGLHRIYAYVFVKNARSTRVLEKAGFEREGLLRKHVKKGDRYQDDLIYSKVK